MPMLLIQAFFSSIFLLAVLAQKPDSTPIGSSDVLPPPVVFHVPPDLIGPSALPHLIEELQQFRSVAASFSLDAGDTNRPSREQVYRGVQAMRAAAAERAFECRVPLLEIVAACDHPDTEPYVLDALAALRTLGEPTSYFMDLLARAPSSYHRAAGAMFVLGWTPSDELAEAAKVATRACLRVGENGVPYAIMQRNLGHLLAANEMRRTISVMISEGKRTAVDKHLLGALSRMYCKTTPGGPLAPASVLHSPVENWARILLWQRAGEDPSALRASIEEMTLYDFLLTEDDPFDHLEPKERLATLRDQVLSLLPESVRLAKPATRPSDD